MQCQLQHQPTVVPFETQQSPGKHFHFRYTNTHKRVYFFQAMCFGGEKNGDRGVR